MVVELELHRKVGGLVTLLFENNEIRWVKRHEIKSSGSFERVHTLLHKN